MLARGRALAAVASTSTQRYQGDAQVYAVLEAAQSDSQRSMRTPAPPPPAARSRGMATLTTRQLMCTCRCTWTACSRQEQRCRRGTAAAEEGGCGCCWQRKGRLQCWTLRGSAWCQPRRAARTKRHRSRTSQPAGIPPPHPCIPARPPLHSFLQRRCTTWISNMRRCCITTSPGAPYVRSLPKQACHFWVGLLAASWESSLGVLLARLFRGHTLSRCTQCLLPGAVCTPCCPLPLRQV